MEEERCIWSSKFGGKEEVGELYGGWGASGCLWISLAGFKRKVAVARVCACLCLGAEGSAGLRGWYALRGPRGRGIQPLVEHRRPGGCKGCPLGSCSHKAPGGGARGPARQEAAGPARASQCEAAGGRAGGVRGREERERGRERSARAARPRPSQPAGLAASRPRAPLPATAAAATAAVAARAGAAPESSRRRHRHHRRRRLCASSRGWERPLPESELSPKGSERARSPGSVQGIHPPRLSPGKELVPGRQRHREGNCSL